MYSIGVDFAPASMGSDFRFLRYLAQAYYFRPWGKIVFASAARSGAVRPLGGQEVVFSERFFAGGAGTVRGVPQDSLGEIDFTGRPVGGEAMLVLNQEVRFPIYKWLQGVGFVDAGNVFPEPADVSLTDLTGSVGYGLRFTVPFGTLRVDYGRRVWPGPVAPAGRWIFGIGQVF